MNDEHSGACLEHVPLISFLRRNMSRNYQKKPREENGWYIKQTHCKRGHDLSLTRTKHNQCRECMKQWRREHPAACRNIAKGSARRSRMKNLYHLTEEEYQEIYEKQKGLCALPSCGKPATDIDHCHVLGKTRGLLCNCHNKAIGAFSDNPILLREAAEYLENFHG